MSLGHMILTIASVVCIGLVATCALCLDSTSLRRTAADYDHRLADVAPYIGVTALFFLAKRATHGYSLRLSHELDWDITAELYAVEGLFVAHFQDLVPDALLGFFSAMYMFGFPYLLVTAPLLYFLLPARRHLKELLVAYVLNYLIGSIFYTLFIAYGPRVHLSAVDGLMYQSYPQTQTVTSTISSNTNVFPSLHTSLSIVVLLFAWRSRGISRRWFSIASFVATTVILSTMILGIHWLVDVVAGVGLGVWTVLAASRLVARAEGDTGPVPAPDESDESIASEVSD